MKCRLEEVYDKVFIQGVITISYEDFIDVLLVARKTNQDLCDVALRSLEELEI